MPVSDPPKKKLTKNKQKHINKVMAHINKNLLLALLTTPLHGGNFCLK